MKGHIEYALEHFPETRLPKTPAARLDVVMQLASPWTDENSVEHEPLIDAETARRLLGADTRPWWRRVLDWVRR